MSYSDFAKSYELKLLGNTIPTSKNTTFLNPRYSSSDEHLNISPLIENPTPYLYEKINLSINNKGVEARPFKTQYIDKTARQDTNLAERMMGINRMLHSTDQLKNLTVSFHTTSGRTTNFGLGLTSIKKACWPFILNPISGYLYVLLDFGQQEPAIAACFASDRELQAAYQQEDLYEHIGKHPRLAGLSRATLKKLILPYSYGQPAGAYAKEHNISETEAQLYWKALREIFHLVDQELNHRSQQAFRDGFVRCLDWAARVTPLSNPLSVRNWPVQAAGADIMRRAVIGLYDAGIDLRLTVHDSFLIRVPIAEQEQQVAKAITVLKQASASVLGGFKLNVKIDGVFDGQVSGEMM